MVAPLLVYGASLACGGGSEAAAVGEVRVAVAANFAEAHAELAGRFAERTGIAVRTSVGSTGQLYAQIVNGAPFDVFLAADTVRPARLEAEGLAVPGSRFTYAEGRLVLYAPGLGPGPRNGDRASAADDPPAGLELLRATADPARGEGRHLAVPNPRLAPYGEAARQTLVALGLWDALEPRIVTAENIAQAFQFVESGAAELGLVAGSYVLDAPAAAVWAVPAELYDPIRQDAVRVEAGGDTAAAGAYIEYLRGDDARALIERRGYGLSPRPEGGTIGDPGVETPAGSVGGASASSPSPADTTWSPR